MIQSKNWASVSCIPTSQTQESQTALRMSAQSRRGQPVSRDLVRIIRESSKCDPSTGTHSLKDHLAVVENRQNQAVEFYLRACATRLGVGELIQ